MATHIALVSRVEDGKGRLSLEDLPIPTPQDNQVLVKIEASAQNPTDIQAFDKNVFGDGAVLGCDFAGTVEKVGSNVSRLKVGERVAGLVWGGEHKGIGTYAQYTVADEKMCFKVPTAFSSSAASTVPLAAATAWLALYSPGALKLKRETTKGESLLIWGGSSSVGLYAIQLAALYGVPITTTCSPRYFDLVKRLGATHAFDYKDPEVAAKIKAAVPDISAVFDTIGNKTSAVLASQAVGAEKGTLVTVRPAREFTEQVEKHVAVKGVLVFTGFGRELTYVTIKIPKSQTNHELVSEFYELVPELLVKGKLEPNETKVLGGLETVEKGFQEYRDGKISGFKIVYKP